MEQKLDGSNKHSLQTLTSRQVEKYKQEEDLNIPFGTEDYKNLRFKEFSFNQEVGSFKQKK